jgi:hypothetical protein
MKTKQIFWSGVTVAMSVGTVVLWQGVHSAAPTASGATATAATETGADATRPAPSSPAGEFTFYKHAEDAPSWGIGYGEEFWRQPRKQDSKSHPGLHLGDVIDRVSHAFTAAQAGAPPQIQTRTYGATFDGTGVVVSPDNPPRKQKSDGGIDRQRLAALSNRTPETPEEEDSLMARITALAAQEAATKGQPKHPQQAVSLPEADPETKAVFETEAVRQGDHALYEAGAGTLQWAVLGNTVQAMLDSHSGLLEHFQAGQEGVAVTWVLPRPLPTPDPLVIEARVTGLTYVGQSADGHHYADGNGKARLRVGNAMIADAAGSRWDVPVEAVQNTLKITVPESVLAQASYPLAVDPIVSPEFGMDTPIIVAASAAQQNPAVATNGATFFVAWEDQRVSGPGSTSIYGARVTTAGTISDPNGIAISPVGASTPAVAANGTGFLIVWVDGRNEATSGLDIYGARISPAGQVLDSGGFAISDAANDQLSPAATADGTDSLVVWQDGRNTTTGPDIYGARVTSGGVVSDPSGIAISGAVGPQASPAVAFNGTDFMVVWTDARDGSDFDIYGSRVDTNGNVLDFSGIAISTVVGGEFSPKVAASGTNFLAVWEDDRNAVTGGNVDIYAARVSGGVALDAGGFRVGVGSADRHVPAVAAGLTDYLVVWQDERNLAASGEDIYGARVTTAGTVTDPTGFAIDTGTNDQTTPVVAFNGSQYLVTWTDARNMATSDLDIYGTLVSPDATVSPAAGLVISTGAAEETAPAVASNGTNYLVVWQDNRDSDTSGADIYGVRVTTGGTVLDPNAIAISTANSDQLSPNVASDGANYFVVWQDERNEGTSGMDIYGARVTAAGAVLDPGGIAISTASSDQLAPTITGSGSGYLVAWTDGRNQGTSGEDIYGARVSSAGTVLDSSGIPICANSANQYSAAAAFDGTDYLVAWSDERNIGTTGVDVYGARVSTSGTVMDPASIPIVQVAGDDIYPAVASAGGGFLVVWEDGRNSATTGDEIYGARVTDSGVVLDSGGFAIDVTPGYEATPAAASSDGAYLVIWQDGRNAATNGADIYGARVTMAGAVLDPAGVAINAATFDQQLPKLASGNPNVFLTACATMETGASRIAGNFVYLDNFPIITEISLGNGAVTLSWLSVPGSTYQAQYTSSLSPVAWNNLGSQIVASGSTTTKTDTTIAGTSKRFYRVILLGAL